MQDILVLTAPGELIDKITILEIKAERMSDAKKVANVKHELSLLLATWKESPNSRVDIASEWAALKDINGALWVIEDDIRDKERDQQFDALLPDAWSKEHVTIATTADHAPTAVPA